MDAHIEIARLRERVSELEREKAEVEEFAAVAAHELLTPVVMIDACAATVSDRLDHDSRNADSLHDLDVLRRGCMQSRLLVESLLHHAAVQGHPVQARRVELDALVADCLALLGPEIRARAARVEVAPLPVVEAERPLICVVYMNLLVNALKYGPRRDAAIRVDAAREDAMWRLGVQSEGQVIPAEERASIFEPHRRRFGERRTRGSGLGLAICRQIVERHGGEITVDPAPDDSGNHFSFTLAK